MEETNKYLTGLVFGLAIGFTGNSILHNYSPSNEPSRAKFEQVYKDSILIKTENSKYYICPKTDNEIYTCKRLEDFTREQLKLKLSQLEIELKKEL